MSSRSFLRLETKGRRSGLPHIVQLRYAWLDGRYFVLGSNGGSDWSRNALAATTATVRLGDFLVDVEVSKAGDAQKEATLEAFAGKYGARLVRQWYPEDGTCLCLQPTGPAVRRGSAGGEQDTKTDYSHWAAEGKDYYSELASAFDSASDEYDYTIARNFINTWTRRRSIEVLSRLLRPGDFVLEIGCGTGAEAVEISRMVSGILATDVSERMVGLLAAKVKARGLEGKVVPRRARAGEIARALEGLGGRRIRVAYSFNGALNCEPSLDSFITQLHSILEPGGYFVCSVRNNVCASEMVSHGAVLQFDRAVPRKKQPTMVSVGGKDIPATYFSPSEFVAHFEPYFKVEQMIGLPAFLPPAYLNDYYVKIRSLTSVLERLEVLMSGTAPFNRLGDQTLFVFRNNPRQGPANQARPQLRNQQGEVGSRGQDR